jgi:hypothetical protein
VGIYPRLVLGATNDSVVSLVETAFGPSVTASLGG